MNIQFYWSKFTELLTNIMGKVRTYAYYFTNSILCYGVMLILFYFTLPQIICLRLSLFRPDSLVMCITDSPSLYYKVQHYLN